MNFRPKSRRQSFKPPKFAQAKPRFKRVSKKRKENRNIRLSKAAGQSSSRHPIAPVGKHWKSKPAIIYRRDQKEICNLAIPEGFAEYRWRVLLMLVRQNGVCCDCGEPLSWAEATFEHENGRGAGKRDDRIAIFEDDHFVRHLNGAAHLICNCRRGSKRTEIYHGNNVLIEKEKPYAA